MGEIMSVEEIEARFGSEWVLLADPEVDEHGRVVRGRLVVHSKDRDEVDRMAIRLRLKHAAYLYTGRMPENTAIVV